MKQCRKCGSDFPTIEVVDGKKRNLQKRKFCLSCSPFGAHNTKKDIEQKSKVSTEIQCSICKRIYQYKHKGDTLDKCQGCVTNEARKNIKKKCVEYKGGKCEKCKYAECIEALEFHHLDPTQKDFGISDGITRSWEKIVLELDKCLLICCRCHREKHAGLW